MIGDPLIRMLNFQMARLFFNKHVHLALNNRFVGGGDSYYRSPCIGFCWDYFSTSD